MARKKMKRYDDGGEIVVTGQRENRVDPFEGISRERMFRDAAAGSAGGGGSGAGAFSSDRNREGFGLGRTAGYSGPTFRGDGYKISAGTGKRGSVGIGAKIGFKKGGSTASKRADGCAIKGKTKGRMV